MEKFAVDLDKVLDEFEFNEDRAEQMVAGKGSGNSTEIGDVTRQHSTNLYGRQTFNTQHPTESSSLNGFNNESSNTSAITSARVDAPSNGSSSLTKKVINHPQNIYWQQDVVLQNSINSSSNNKFNVSGVFSSLNEYLNAGNSNIGLGLKNEDSGLTDHRESENSEDSLGKSSSSRESMSFQDVVSSRVLGDCLCNCKKFGIHTCHHIDIPSRPILDEGSDAEKKMGTPQKECWNSDNVLKDQDNLKTSSPVDSNSILDSSPPHDLLEGAGSSCILNEGVLDTKIVDINLKNGDICSSNTKVSSGMLSSKDDYQTEDRTCSATSNYDSSFDISRKEKEVSINRPEDETSSRSNICDGSTSEEFPTEVLVEKDSPYISGTDSGTPVSTPSENHLKVDSSVQGSLGEEFSLNIAELNEKALDCATESNSFRNVIGFDAVDDYSKEDLEKYLEELCDKEQISDGVDEVEFNGNSEILNPLHYPVEDVSTECKPDITAVMEGNNDIQTGPSTTEIKEPFGSNSKQLCTTESDGVVENEVNLKSNISDTNLTIQNTQTLDAVSPCINVLPPYKASENDLQSKGSEEAVETSDQDLKANISISMLNTSKSTANVTNVISIECQQTKNCMVNGHDHDYNANTGTTVGSTDRNDNSVMVNESKDNNGDGIYCSKEKSALLSNISDSSECGNLSGNGTILPSNSSVPVDKQVAGNCSENRSSVVNGQLGAVLGECMVQVARDGSRTNVLEEDRPCRPKFLLLPSKIIVETQPDSSENVSSVPQNASVGLPGETPGTHSEPSQEMLNNNSANPVSEISGNSILTSPDASDSSSLEVAISPVPSVQTTSPSNNDSSPYILSPEERSLGKLPPFWVPDSDAPNCMLCDLKFTVLKRRHHCRACGKVLCSKCCSLKYRLEYMENAEARVCHPCFDILARVLLTEQGESASESPSSLPPDSSGTPLGRQPNPNNPMEYCSTIPPLEQAASTSPQPVPSVLVPVGVLKREGCGRAKGEVTKQVMFSDGIRPGGDLTELDGSSEPRLPYRRQERILKRVGTPPGITPNSSPHSTLRSLLSLEPKTKSYIPNKGLPPLATLVKGELKLEEVSHPEKLFPSLKSETEPIPMFALNRNLFVQVKILNLDCCVNRQCWCFSTIGMSSVGQDEIVIILEYLPEDTTIPKDIFHHLNTIYQDASRGNMVSEMGHTVFQGSTFLGSSEHGGFIYIRTSFQCLHKLILPAPPYLVAVLFHRWEIPWAKVFPIRLMLRLGAEFRYYPCMLVSVRQRKPVFCEIGHTIINLLADFRNLSYTLPSVRGLVIHMEDRHTSILLPKNRYDQVARALNNSNDHVLALAANFSMSADSHLVCIQSHEDESYHTQAINIHNKPRKVTGASFVVFNGALKMSSNLTAKSSIVEDGLMVQITPDTIQELRTALRKMQDFSVRCGPAGAVLPDEMVNIKWVQDDRSFNIGVVSFIDGLPLDGVPSIRVHNGTDYMGTVRFIRWTEVFILQSGENSERNGDPVDISRLSESLARATCLALVNYLDLLAQAGLTKIAVRANIHPENVGYEAGSRVEKLPPIYMKSLDNELVPVLHKAASMASESPPVLLELIFHVMLQ